MCVYIYIYHICVCVFPSALSQPSATPKWPRRRMSDGQLLFQIHHGLLTSLFFKLPLLVMLGISQKIQQKIHPSGCKWIITPVLLG